MLRPFLDLVICYIVIKMQFEMQQINNCKLNVNCVIWEHNTNRGSMHEPKY